MTRLPECQSNSDGVYWTCVSQSCIAHVATCISIFYLLVQVANHKTKASKVLFPYSHNYTVASRTAFHGVWQVWLSSGPPGVFNFRCCEWLWNWLIDYWTCLRGVNGSASCQTTNQGLKIIISEIVLAVLQNLSSVQLSHVIVFTNLIDLRAIKGTFFWAYSGIGIVGISQTIVRSLLSFQSGCKTFIVTLLTGSDMSVINSGPKRKNYSDHSRYSYSGIGPKECTLKILVRQDLGKILTKILSANILLRFS